ncbi:polysaccharide biosynthesis tyrosine autokinase [Sphingomonas sp. R647]|uniref:GumC family protein n=1 Tax=Sphingomonas sp. R647 TaxID=2875233 RepID=UPI001CD6AD1A|nr:polysaccharide biosynthesis tyrosine autokinase [Sphingomonas sp. R647]MCA1196359.1 polysaccharide biosynthesis tyrosine autokinase [Sphingomonas sp. R647]
MDVPKLATRTDERADAEAQERLLIAQSEEQSSAVDIRAIWATLYRSRFVIIAILAVAAMLGIASIFLMPRTFEARASIQVDQQTTKILGTEDVEPQVIGSDADRFLQTQVDLLKSRSMAVRVAESLDLAANDTFLKQMSGGGELEPLKEGTTRQTLVLDLLQRNLRVDLPRNTRVVGIMFQSRDPKLAAVIANSYASNFIEGNVERKFSTSSYSRQFLQNQLALSKTRLEESERQLIAYARSAQLIDARSGAREAGAAEGPRSLTTANLVQLNTELADAQANDLKTRQRWMQARSTALMSLPEVLSNDAIGRLSQKRAEDVASLNELRRRLKEDHPTVIRAVAELESLDSQIDRIATSIRDSIRSQYLTANRQYRAIAGQVSALKRATLSEQDRGVRYNILQREVDTNRQIYDGMLQRFKEVSAEAGVTSNNITVVDTAEQPVRPTSPKPMLNLFIALFGGIALALLYAFGRDYLDDSIRDPQDVEQRLHVPLLGVVPSVRDQPPLYALTNPKSEIAEAYHSIRTSIQLSSNQGIPRAILVTGSGKSEGKSTTSYALARDFALIGKKVLVIDADLRRPSLHRTFDLPQLEQGLSSVLARLYPADAAIRRSAVKGLDVMTSGPLPPDPAMLFAGDAMSSLLGDLAGLYDVVILDGPPVLALADATQLSAAAQATIFVLEASSSHFGQARNAIDRLLRAGGHVIGAVVTKYDPQSTGYGAAYNYYRYDYDGSRET